MSGRGALLLICWVGLLAGCTKDAEHPTPLSWLTMGTVAVVQCGQAADAAHVRDMTRETFDQLETRFSSWVDTSELAQVNALAGSNRAHACSSALGDLLVQTVAITRHSEGAFNPLVGSIMRAWGFNGAQSIVAVPREAVLEAARAQADWRGLLLTNRDGCVHVQLTQPGMRLDLGGIAKGYAVDCAFARIQAAGFTNVLVDLGGNLRGTGEAVRGRGGWRVGVRNPFDGSAIVGTFLLQEGEATATSGNYERFVQIGDVRYSHIMDARTGYPVKGIAGVTVVAPTAVLADALSTTLFVMGPERGVQLLASYPGCEALWIPDDPASLTVLATAGLAERFTPTGDKAFSMRVLSPVRNHSE